MFKKHRRKVPVVLQMEISECGAACLGMVLGYYGRFIPIEQLRTDCNVTRDGSSAKYITLAARHHGMETKAYKESAEEIKKRTDFPLIIHWNFNHFVVLTGFKKNKAVIHDPACGKVTVGWDTFVRSFTGIVLSFQPGKNFQPFGRQASSSLYLRRTFRGLKGSILVIVAVGFVYALLQLLPPMFYKIYTDTILLEGESVWLRALLILLGVVCAAGIIAGSTKNILLARLKARYQVRSTASFIWKLLRLPAPFYAQRFDGDIVERAEENGKIAELLFEIVIPAVMELLLLLVLFFVMLILDMRMALVTFTVGMIQFILVRFISEESSSISRSISRDQGKMSGMMLSGISMAETVKASGAETETVGRILSYQAKYDNSTLALQKNRLFLSGVPYLLSMFCNVLIITMGIQAIFAGKYSVGMLVAFQSFLQLFFRPLRVMTGAFRASGEISGSVDRLWDVMNYDEAVGDAELFEDVEDDTERLSGRVEIKNVCFGYSPVAEPLLRDICLSVKPGDMIAITGGSGCGKSTFSKLICGLYRPVSGQILFDGIPGEQIDHYVFTRSVAVVDQNISLFAGSIWDNVTMWNSEADEETVIRACKDACIHEEIMMRRGGYDYQVREGGFDFSGGQRQRIEIARAFAANPSILLLDEATSALDVMTEKKIMDAVRARNITCFIVAHRLSTIRDADQILLLRDGELAEHGTHEELMRLNGDYAALVRAD